MQRSFVLGLSACALVSLLASLGCSSGGGVAEGIGDGETAGTSTDPGGPATTGAGGSAIPSGSDTSGSGATSGTWAATGGSSSGGAADAPATSGSANPNIEPGTLTAGAWDDNRNFDRFVGYRTDIISQGVSGLPPFELSEHQSAHASFPEPRPAKQSLDVSFVIDTTGSMGDEMAYLQTEFLSISDRITRAYPNAEQRWSLIVYRDLSDDYVVRWFDFRSDVAEFQTNLAAQVADGGGDYPEAADMALAKMTQLAWRTDTSTARIAFWVADAPHHDDRAAALADAVREARTLDVHIYPIASSGVDDLTEFTMRSAAQLTGGRYLFLTNDSGVGGDHKEPTIPCYFVTKLDAAILRMVDIEMTGVYREPAPAEILRTGGNPQDGACTLASGEIVRVF